MIPTGTVEKGERIRRNKGFLVACGIAAWAGLEVGGKGTGIGAHNGELGTVMFQTVCGSPSG